MSTTVSGVVVAKDFIPPPLAPPKKWCFLTVETDSGDRIKIRLHQRMVDVAVIGDRVRFTKPGRKKKQVKEIARI